MLILKSPDFICYFSNGKKLNSGNLLVLHHDVRNVGFKFIGDRIFENFQQQQIPIEWVNANNDSRNYSPNEQSIKLLTMHSSKGLEFSVVCIPGLGYMSKENQVFLEEARLMYVAMTRSIDQLIVTSHHSSEFTKRIDLALAKVRMV
ncbi:MAG TPA: 3'-5' exonuclease [Nostocaceae cyanobacterium]|nr:3'-5' exonuclease [Nostocaceae cyanobacterium]